MIHIVHIGSLSVDNENRPETVSRESLSKSSSFGKVACAKSGAHAIWPRDRTASVATFGRSHVHSVSSSRTIWCEVPGAPNANATKIFTFMRTIGSPSAQKT